MPGLAQRIAEHCLELEDLLAHTVTRILDTYEAVARSIALDRRTVKKYIQGGARYAMSCLPGTSRLEP